jgi:hypothetical protein
MLFFIGANVLRFHGNICVQTCEHSLLLISGEVAAHRKRIAITRASFQQSRAHQRRYRLLRNESPTSAIK